MTPETINAVYDILVEEAGANEIDRDHFVRVWPKCVEFRFAQLFDIKWVPVRHRRKGVPTCYVESADENATLEREAIIIRTNARLAELMESVK